MRCQAEALHLVTCCVLNHSAIYSQFLEMYLKCLAVTLSFSFRYLFEAIQLCVEISYSLFLTFVTGWQRAFHSVNFTYLITCKGCSLVKQNGMCTASCARGSCPKLSSSFTALERHRFVKRAQALAPWMSPNVFYGGGDRNSQLSTYQLNPLLQRGEVMGIISEGNRDEKQDTSQAGSAVRHHPLLQK